MKDKRLILRGEVALILAIIINRPYSRVKITFDVTCLFVTACLTYFALGKILGLEIVFLQFYK